MDFSSWHTVPRPQILQTLQKWKRHILGLRVGPESILWPRHAIDHLKLFFRLLFAILGVTSTEMWSPNGMENDGLSTSSSQRTPWCRDEAAAELYIRSWKQITRTKRWWWVSSKMEALGISPSEILHSAFQFDKALLIRANSFVENARFDKVTSSELLIKSLITNSCRKLEPSWDERKFCQNNGVMLILFLARRT